MNEKININKGTFETYLIHSRNDLVKVVVKYTVAEHLELRTAIDSFLIAFDQAVNKINSEQ